MVGSQFLYVDEGGFERLQHAFKLSPRRTFSSKSAVDDGLSPSCHLLRCQQIALTRLLAYLM
jgi:hypothetical protein